MRSDAPIESREALLRVLETDLGYCDCAYDDALPLLRDFLRAVSAWNDSGDDAERRQSAHQSMRQLLNANGSAGMLSLFVHFLERANLVQHNFNLYDLWITPRGRWVLAGLERFGPKPETGESGTASD